MCTSASHRRILYLTGTYTVISSNKTQKSTENKITKNVEDDEENEKEEHIETCDGDAYAQRNNNVPGLQTLSGSGTFWITNLIFSVGNIAAVNSAVHINACHFENGTVLFTDQELSLKSYDMYNSFMAYTSYCESGVLHIANTTFKMSVSRNFTTLMEAAIMEHDILMLCKNIQFSMTGSDVGNRRFLLAATNSLTAYFKETSFRGNPQYETKVGGITIMAPFYYKYIHIEHCSFKNLYPKNNMLQLGYQSQWQIAPILINNNVKKEYSSYCGSYKLEKRTLKILNNTFFNNYGAISINGLDGSADCHNNSFERNHAVIKGGAVWVDSSKIIDYEEFIVQITIDNCDFHENVADILSPERESLPSNHTWSLYKPLFYETSDLNYTILAYSIDELDRFVIVTDNGTIKSEEIGKGGAVFVEDNKNSIYLKMTNSRFINNSARTAGGGIYINRLYREPVINNCFLSSTGNRKTKGELIYSYESRVTVVKTDFSAEKNNIDYSDKTATASSVYLDRGIYGSSIVTSMSFTCPPGSNPNVQNTSTLFYYGKRPLLLYSLLKLNCKPCNDGYSLEGGMLRIVHPWENQTRSLSIVIHEVVTCYPCPPEALCVNGLYPRDNYWGEAHDKRVYFYKCPPSCCCLNSTCTSYNSCARHRTGTLCSRCQPGYSEALFSKGCLPNKDCTATWVLIVAAASAFAYVAFLFFQNDFKTLFLKLGKEMMSEKPGTQQSKLLEQDTGPNDVDEGKEKHIEKIFNKEKQKEEGVKGQNHIDTKDPPKRSKSESSAFLVILFYYFQEASLLNVQTAFEEQLDIPRIILQLKSLFAGIFMFRVEFFNLALSDVCTFTNFTPVAKAFFKTLFYFLMISIVTVGLLVQKCHERSSGKSYPWFGKRILSAIVLTSMFSFQKLSQSCLLLLDCTTLRDRKVLFIDGETTCYQVWQYVLLVYPLITWIIPFTLVLTLGPSLVASSKVGYKEFLFSCLIPLPFVVSWVVRFLIAKKKTGGDKDQVNSICNNDGVNLQRVRKDNCTITAESPGTSSCEISEEPTNIDSHFKNRRILSSNCDRGIHVNRMIKSNVSSENYTSQFTNKSDLSSKSDYVGNSQNAVEVKDLTPEASGIYETLQGPCRHLHLGRIPLCWSGVLLLRRILLIVVATATSNDFQRVLALLLLCLVFLIHHQAVLPYKGKLANMAATFSGSALLVSIPIFLLHVVCILLDTQGQIQDFERGGSGKL